MIFPFFAGLLCQLPGCLLPWWPWVAAFFPSTPNVFQWSLIVPLPSSRPLPRSLTQLQTHLEKLLQISSFCQLSPEILALCGGREKVGLFTESLGKNRKLHAIHAVSSNLINWWFLIKIFLFLVGKGAFLKFFFFENGKCELFLYS